MALVKRNAGRYRQWVDLADVESDQPQASYRPSRMKCAILPGPPSAFDENKTTSIVEMPYHPQVTFNTVLTFVDRSNVTHQLYVRGIQDVGLMNQELTLTCEEVLQR